MSTKIVIHATVMEQSFLSLYQPIKVGCKMGFDRFDGFDIKYILSSFISVLKVKVGRNSRPNVFNENSLDLTDLSISALLYNSVSVLLGQ